MIIIKLRLLKFLICPKCKKKLTCKIFKKYNNEVKEGLLICKKCSSQYPIINGIPRILPIKYQRNLLKKYPGFFKKYKISINFSENDKRDIKQKTLESFSWEWKTFSQMYKEWEKNFLFYINPKKPEFFKKKFGLDVGCGMGRHIFYATKYGSEMIGVDLSESVDVAAKINKNNKAHFIQSDIYNLPLKPKTFDFIYSFGVLHHLPKPYEGFKKLTPLLKKGGSIFIWVYKKDKLVWLLPTFKKIRSITTRLPYYLLYHISFFLSVIERVFFNYPYLILKKIPITRKFAEKIIFNFHAKYPLRVLQTDWFDNLSVPIYNCYTKNEIKRWFKKQNLRKIETPTDWQGHMSAIK